MGDISKGLTWNPNVVPIPECPASHAERCPPRGNIDGAPEVAIGAIVIYPIPTAKIIQQISMILQALREILRRSPP
jgi:hypothetical protein